MEDKTVQDWMDAGSNVGRDFEERKIINDIAGTIDLGVLRLTTVLQDMGPFLGPEVGLPIVARALELLPSILNTMQTEVSSRHDVHVIVEYLCARLQNHEENPTFRAGLRQVADSLTTLAGWGIFTRGDAATIAKAVFGLVRSPSNVFISQKPDTRLSFYTLISFLFKTFMHPLQRDLGVPTLITGIVDLAALEKNPSCLKVLFQIYAHVSKDWNLEPAEISKLLEGFARYFPITLGGASRDPNTPAPEELKELLLACFTSSDMYAEETFSILITGLDADQAANKRQEILSAFYTCSLSYSPTTLITCAPKIWDTLKYEIWNGESEDFIVESLRILRALFYSLRTMVWESDENLLTALVAEISNEIFNKMSHEKKSLQSCGRILRAISSSSSHIFSLVTKTILPKLDVLAQTVELPSEWKMVLGVFNGILQARLDLDDPNLRLSAAGDDKPDVTIIDAFSKFKESIVGLYFGHKSEVDDGSGNGTVFGVAAIDGFVLLNKIPDFLSSKEKSTILENIDVVLLNSSREHESHVAALRAIKDMSSLDPTVFTDTTLPNLMKQFPETLSKDIDTRKKQTTEIAALLEELIFISCSAVTGVNEVPAPGFRQRNFDACMASLIQLWESLIKKMEQPEYTNAILVDIYRGMVTFDSVISGLEPVAGNLGVGRYSHILLPLLAPLVKLYEHADGAQYVGISNTYDINESTVNIVSKVAALAVRSESRNMKGEDSFLLAWNREHNPSAIWSLFCTEAEGLPLPQWELRLGPKEKCLANVLSVSLLAGIKPIDKAKVNIEIGDTALAMLLNAVSTESQASPFARRSMLESLQLLVNKYSALDWSIDQSVGNESRKLVDVMVDLVASCPSKSEEEAHNIYQALAFLTAAAVAAQKPQATALLELMITGIASPRHGRKIAQSFRIILAPSDMMSEQNFCYVRRLRKQRVFTMAVTPLLNMWRTSVNQEVKGNALLALTGLLYYMEPTILKENIGSVLPVILEGANVQNDDWAKHASIQTILTLLPLCPEAMESHLDSLINRMTDRTHNTLVSPSDSNVSCRAAALDVLALLVRHISPAVLTRRKAKLMFELDVALDDCSSTVRNRADQCKMAWFNLED